MSAGHIAIVGGGLAGLSTACYARANGFETTILEHNRQLGGVCTAWQRGPYTIDGCIHWLTGGPFMRIYEELGIIPPVEVRPLDLFATYRNARTGTEVEIRSDVEAMRASFKGLSPGDADEIDRILDGALTIADMDPGFDHPPELATLRERLSSMWEMRGAFADLVHFRKPWAVYLRTHIEGDELRRCLARLLPDEGPALFLLFMLGYLARGQLSRPVGTTARFRDALVDRHRALGGEARLESTVEEILVEGDRVRGVRLADGTLVEADIVVSTASAPETILHLLGGRYGADALRDRLEKWKLFQPVVLVSYGVESPMTSHPTTLILDGIEPLGRGAQGVDGFVVRIFSDEPDAAPPGHTVVQAMVGSDYEWWATRGADYADAKDAFATRLRDVLGTQLPELRTSVRMTDVATPLTFWREARSWRGAFEGWLPTPDNFMRHVEKSLPGLEGFYMAGQWVEPGGGVPTALLSGRQLVQILCDHQGREFRAR